MNLALAIALPLLLSASPPPSDESGVREAFSTYRTALLKKDGAAAAQVVDGDTLEYYSKIRSLALSADAATVKQQPLLDRVMILRVRQQLSADAVEKMSGKDLFVYGVQQGWVSAASVANIELGKVKVAGKDATGEVIARGKPAPFNFEFKKTEQGWRFSLLPLLALGEPAMKQMVKQVGQDENQFIVTLVERVSQKPVPETIWQPLVSSSPPKKTKP